MKVVLAAYEKLGTTYLDYRRTLKSEPYIRALTKYIPKKARVLDVGCGAGEPVDDLLVKWGYEVEGIDLSPSLITHARRAVPEASFNVKDMQDLSMAEYRVDAIVCLYALFHISRALHKKMIKIFATYLPVGGAMLISMGDRAFEGNHKMYGVESFSSQYGSERNKEIIESVGFKIVETDMAKSGGECHQMIIARRIY